MNNSNYNSSPAKPQLMFGDLLMKCMGLEVRRRVQKNEKVDSPEFEAIRAFCKQAIRDSQYLIRGTYPDDIIQGAKRKEGQY